MWWTEDGSVWRIKRSIQCTEAAIEGLMHLQSRNLLYCVTCRLLHIVTDIGVTLWPISVARLWKQIHFCIYRNICDPRCVLFLERNQGNCFSKIRHSASHRKPSDVLKQKCTRQVEWVFIFFTTSAFFIVISLSVGSAKSRKTKRSGVGCLVDTGSPSVFTATLQILTLFFRFRVFCCNCHSETRIVCVCVCKSLC